MKAPNVVEIDEALARRLESTGRYRVLRSIPDLPTLTPPLPAGAAVAIALDVETTGTGPDDDVIELAMVRFAYGIADGRVLGSLATFSALRRPQRPIPPEVTRLTGLDDRAVAGMSIDEEEVSVFLLGARLAIAHNASFDRPRAEALWPAFSLLPWACSCTEIDWRAEGFESASLGQIVSQSGLHFGGHRALNDVFAMLHVLSLPLPTSRRIAMSVLLEHARSTSFRIWAESAPFAAKDLLKGRGYRWSNGDAGAPRSWFRDVIEADLDAELEFLRTAVYGNGNLTPTLIATRATDRFTPRSGAVVATPTCTGKV